MKEKRKNSLPKCSSNHDSNEPQKIPTPYQPRKNGTLTQNQKTENRELKTENRELKAEN